jgi:NAD dependent epimerase/dehydratase
MKIEDKKIMVTGAGGFIGSHLVEKLVRLGSRVKCFVRYNSRGDFGFIETLPLDIRESLEVISGDLRDYNAVYDASKGVEVIFHLGALISIPYSYIHPRENIETNVIGTFNVLSAARENGIIKIVHTSSSEVYGTAQYVPIDEKHMLQGQSPYSASKIGADKIAESFYLSFGLPVATIRPFNTFGPRQSTRAVIPTIITQALTKEKILLGSLHPTRDYTYVQDLIEAFIKMAKSPDSIGEVVNVGSNYEISIGDLAKKIIGLTGRNVEIANDPARLRPANSEVERLWCNNIKAKKLLDWEPKISLDTGLKETIEWISTRINNYKTDIYSV